MLFTDTNRDKYLSFFRKISLWGEDSPGIRNGPRTLYRLKERPAASQENGKLDIRRLEGPNPFIGQNWKILESKKEVLPDLTG
jgi:hypothetical protein